MEEQTPVAKDELEEGPQVAKLVRPSEIGESVQEWKLARFENTHSEVDELSAEVLSRMQESMRPQLNEQTKVLKQEAYDEAYQKGYQEGLEQGLQEGSKQGEAEAKAEIFKQLEPKLAQFESLLDALKTPYELVENRLYSELVDLALHISETVLYKSVAENREWVLKAIQDSIAQLPESKTDISVYLNPEDLAFLQISKPTIAEKWHLHENPSLSVGSCIVKQDHSSVIHDWKHRFDEVSHQLLDDASAPENLVEAELAKPAKSDS